ncbi:hypothetical protein AgCh_015786 [Apium graveolens]
MGDSFDVESCSVGGVAITSADITKILGVKDGGKIISETISKDVSTRLDALYGKKTLCKLTESLKLFTQDDLNFRETFMLYVFGKKICPSSKSSPSRKLYGVLSVLPSTIGYNWSKFILDILAEAIKDYKNRAKGKDESSTRNMGLGAWNKKETKIAMEKIKKEILSVECAACVGVNQRLERSEERPDMLEKYVFHECNNTDKTKQRLRRLENSTSETQQRLTRLENIILRQNILKK